MSDEIELRDPDAPPANALDGIFVLPEEISDNALIRGWYEEMVTQLRREAQGIPMQVLQFTLMERIAYFYANMRYQEIMNPGMTNRERMSNIDAWQKMIDQFNRLLEKHNDKVVNEVLVKVQNVLLEGLPLVTDPAERQALRRFYGEAFAKENL